VKKLGKKLSNLNQGGFTLIELLMVILVIAILAVIGITQFVNYGKDSRDAATKSNLQILRRAIAEKNGMMRVRCNVQTASFPPVDSINANDINGGATPPCTSSQVTIPDSLFISAGIPVNPWSKLIQTNQAASSLIVDCQATGSCQPVGSRCSLNCAGSTYDGTENGWCYNSVTGEIWANTARNDGDDPAVADADDECSY